MNEKNMTVAEEQEIVRAWDAVADCLPAALAAPGQVMLVPRKARMEVILGGLSAAWIHRADGAWRFRFMVGLLEEVEYTVEDAQAIADALTRAALTRIACAAPVSSGCFDVDGPRIRWAGGGPYQGRPLINLNGCANIRHASWELMDALKRMGRDVVAPLLEERLRRAVEGRPGVVLAAHDEWAGGEFTVESTATGRTLAWVRVGSDGVLDYIAHGRANSAPLWPGRSPRGLGEPGRRVLNRLIDLVEDEIIEHTNRINENEENNR